MTKDIFEKREIYLEEEYFGKKEFALLEKLKGVFQKKVDKESIRKAASVTDEELLDRMVEIQLNGEMMAAFQLYPLVEIAWADGDLSEKEARSVLAAAERHGVRPGTKGYEMLDRATVQGTGSRGAEDLVSLRRAAEEGSVSPRAGDLSQRPPGTLPRGRCRNGSPRETSRRRGRRRAEDHCSDRTGPDPIGIQSGNPPLLIVGRRPPAHRRQPRCPRPAVSGSARIASCSDVRPGTSLL